VHHRSGARVLKMEILPTAVAYRVEVEQCWRVLLRCSPQVPTCLSSELYAGEICFDYARVVPCSSQLIWKHRPPVHGSPPWKGFHKDHKTKTTGSTAGQHAVGSCFFLAAEVHAYIGCGFDTHQEQLQNLPSES